VYADGRWAVVACFVVFGFLDDVGVVSSAFDDAGIGSIPAAFGASFVISSSVSVNALTLRSGGKVRLAYDMAADHTNRSHE